MIKLGQRFQHIDGDVGEICDVSTLELEILIPKIIPGACNYKVHEKVTYIAHVWTYLINQDKPE